ncbi:MAG: hypothetical protein AVDCRST_MAG77-4943 [uncultured Chloroflexi bacterium]|uniref:Uncharacterized protein n=1 Tax=uncultured Chloroflexota bacterium TaxID=166587 RepID=A0A6J4K196_9CHLR|nr:MAG: hypothetical protein AVDCRST_MAG77-4943 [uncultured Chloroflexota bacterium]
MPTLTVGHWAAAQEIAERWRHSAHAILASALRDEATDAAAGAASKLLVALTRAGGRQKRGELQRRLNWSAAELDAALLASEGRVRVVEDNTTGGRPSVWVEVVPEEMPPPSTKGTKAPDREEPDGFSSNETTKGSPLPSETPFSAFSSNPPEWPGAVAVDGEEVGEWTA